MGVDNGRQVQQKGEEGGGKGKSIMEIEEPGFMKSIRTVQKRQLAAACSWNSGYQSI